MNTQLVESPLRLRDRTGTEQVLCRPNYRQSTVTVTVPEDSVGVISLEQARELRDFLDGAIVRMENRPCPAQQPLFPGMPVEARHE